MYNAELVLDKSTKRERESSVDFLRCGIPTISLPMTMALIAWMQSSMMIVIGESLKNLDKLTNGELLAKYPGVDWKGAKGARDIISHHYFDLDAEAVYGICQNDMPSLIAAIEKIIEDLSHSSFQP